MADAPPDGGVLIDPPPHEWGGMIASRRASAGRLADAAASFRREIGLPPGGPIVMSGHQAGFWHPGIVAKYAAVRAAGAPSAWLVADLDDNQPLHIRVPRRDAHGAVRAEAFDLAAAPAGRPDAATGHRPVAQITPDPPRELEPAADALRQSAQQARSLAGQMHAAASHLLADLGTPRPDHTVFATAMSATTLFATALEEMTRDPEGCVRAYNAAVAERTDAGVRPLAASAERGRWELPIWRAGPGEPRTPVMVSPGERLDPARHAARGLLMTGLLRAAGCDLFIHGMGGGIYDTITERWLAAWLGMALAPAAVVSATLRLDLGLGDLRPEDAEAHIALAHKARHDPALLGLDQAAHAKRELVSRIAALDRGRPERRALYLRMHEVIEAARATGHAHLAEAEQAADAARAVLRSREAVMDRTWSFVLHEPAAISALSALVADAFAGVTPPRG